MMSVSNIAQNAVNMAYIQNQLQTQASSNDSSESESTSCSGSTSSNETDNYISSTNDVNQLSSMYNANGQLVNGGVSTTQNAALITNTLDSLNSGAFGSSGYSANAMSQTYDFTKSVLGEVYA